MYAQLELGMREEIATLEELLNIMQRECKTAVHDDTLGNLLEDKDALLGRLQRATASRESLLVKNSYSPDRHGMSRCLAGEDCPTQLKPLFESLMEATRRCRELNLTLASLTQRKINFMEGLVQERFQRPLTPSRLYNRGGTRPSDGCRLLGTA